MYRQDQCKIQVHLLEQEAEKGNAKYVALFFSMKHLNRHGIIYDWKKLNLSLLKFKVCHKSYVKYINRLIEMGWIIPKGKNIQLIGQNALTRLYPTKKVKLIYLNNTFNLKHEIEKAIIKINIKRQLKSIKRSQYKGIMAEQTKSVFKTIRGIGKLIEAVASQDVSLNQKNFSKAIGFKSPTTAWRRQVKMRTEGFLDVVNRKINASETEFKNEVYAIYKKGSFYIKQLSNELNLRDDKFGIKGVWRQKEQPLVKCYATSDLFMENF